MKGGQRSEQLLPGIAAWSARTWAAQEAGSADQMELRLPAEHANALKPLTGPLAFWPAFLLEACSTAQEEGLPFFSLLLLASPSPWQ